MLELKTLAVALGVFRWTQVPLLLYLHTIHRSYAPTRCWAVGGLLEAVGYLLLVALRDHSSALVSIILGNLVVIAGALAFDSGLIEATGRRIPKSRLAMLLGLSCLAFTYWTYVTPSAPHRVIVYTLAVVPLRLFAVWRCWSYPRGAMGTTFHWLALLNLLSVAVLIRRGLGAQQIASILTSTREQTLMWVFGFAHVLLSTCGVALLAAQRLQEELARAQERADVANQAKSTFLLRMTQELRGPLLGVLGETDYLLGLPLTFERRSGVETIQRSSEHLLTLMNEILDLSKVEADRLELDEQEFHLSQLLESLLAMVMPRAREKGVRLELLREGMEPQERVFGDARRLRQVLLNLLANGLKFTERGSVVLTCRRHQELVEFSVQDSGVGMDGEQLAQLFNPFTQVGESRSRREGTGLGLVISRRLARLLGGELRVESSAGLGSRFWFEARLPVTSSSSRQELPSLQQLPLELREQLRHLCELGDGVAIEQCVARVGPPWADGLRAAAARFDYDAILRALEEP